MAWVPIVAAVAGSYLSNRDKGDSGGSGQANTIAAKLSGAAQPTLSGLKRYGGEASKLGFEDLIGLLRQGGEIDPRKMNFQLTDIARRTAANQDTQRDRFSRSGFGASGLNDAIMAAIGQGGDESAARLRADDAANSDARRRQNLQLLHDLVIGPAVNISGAATGAGVAGAQLSSQEKIQGQQSQDAFLSGLLQSISQMSSNKKTTTTTEP